LFPGQAAARPGGSSINSMIYIRGNRLDDIRREATAARFGLCGRADHFPSPAKQLVQIAEEDSIAGGNRRRREIGVSEPVLNE
jgi:hypothetical protein